MLASKFVQNSRALLSRNGSQVKTCVEPVKKYHTVGVPARTRFSTAENAIYGAVLFASLFGIPIWVLYHLPDYQKENRNEYTGK